MATKEWNVTHNGHRIRVEKTDSDGARLYVDGELIDTTNDLYASQEEATLAGTFGDNESFRVEAFITPSAVAIRVNEELILGGRVYAVASD